MLLFEFMLLLRWFRTGVDAGRGGVLSCQSLDALEIRECPYSVRVRLPWRPWAPKNGFVPYTCTWIVSTVWPQTDADAGSSVLPCMLPFLETLETCKCSS
jgi:hypothetical protein